MASIFKYLKGFYSTDLSIDLGTANTLVFVKDKGIVLDEPSVVAIKKADGHRTVVAVGSEAKRMLGRVPGNIEAIRPLKDGVIADFQVTEKMLQHFIQLVHGENFFKPSPRILICVPCQSTQVERRAIRESALQAGAREVRLILKHENISALLVTHDQNEAFAMGDNICVLNQGRVQQTDSAYNLYHNPRNRFVAEFIG